MYFESVQQNIDTLVSEKFDFLKGFHDYQTSEGGLIDHSLEKFFPHLTLCRHHENLTTSPRIIYSGSQSGTRKVFGENWANNLPDHKGTPDLNLEKLAAPGYMQAANNGYSCDLVETVIYTSEGPKSLSFIRYISVLESYSGIKFFALAGTVLNRTLQ